MSLLSLNTGWASVLSVLYKWNLSAWWVVHKVNRREWFHTPGDVGYHDTQALDGDIDEVY
jgi:hypothetical protein